jgi:Uma2 family endonuclease
MTETKIRIEEPMELLVPWDPMDNEWLYELCRANPELRIERTSEGEVEVMMPTGGETGNRNFEMTTELALWTRRDGTGVGFDSSTGFVLPNGAMRSPDASWASRDRLSNLSPEQKRKLLPLCPDFVIKLRSPSDSMPKIEAKMREYIENGAKLGWLLDPEERKVHVYKADGSVEALEDPESVSADPVLPGFALELKSVWESGF